MGEPGVLEAMPFLRSGHSVVLHFLRVLPGHEMQQAAARLWAIQGALLRDENGRDVAEYLVEHLGEFSGGVSLWGVEWVRAFCQCRVFFEGLRWCGTIGS